MMAGTDSFMASEIEEMPEAVARLSHPSARAQSRKVAGRLAALDPAAVLTVARGSSDHAACYLGYATQLLLRIPVASIGPSIASIYDVALKASGLPVIAISQSGASSDIVALSASLQGQGGTVIALTNSPGSALAATADVIFDVSAGPERAVAATKSYMNSVVAGLWVLADWAQDDDLATALSSLPEAMTVVTPSPQHDKLEAILMCAQQVTVLGRGPGLGLAQEVALKLIETCGIHASAYSAAEVLHGPSALLADGHPVLVVATGEVRGMEQALERVSAQGAMVCALPRYARTGHPVVDPLLELQQVYRVIERVTRARGADPDNPRHLKKETRTV